MTENASVTPTAAEAAPARALGVDVSFWQDNNATPEQINFFKTRSAGANFVFVRCCQDIYPDPDFEYNWRQSKAAGLLRGAYHFLDYRVSAKRQVDFFIAQLRADPGELPPVLDIERHPQWALPPAANLHAMVKVFVTELENAFGRKPLIYTNPAMIQYSLNPVPAWMTEYPLWIAHYGVSEPGRFNPWRNWVFWQYTDKGDGLQFGMESLGLDMNLFNGSEQELRTWAGVGTPPPPDNLTLEQKVALLWAAHPELHPRT